MGPLARTAAAAKWRDLVDRWRRSGLSVAEFCRQQRISQPSFFAKRATAPIWREPPRKYASPGLLTSPVERGTRLECPTHAVAATSRVARRVLGPHNG